jgi:hypothetical protein
MGIAVGWARDFSLFHSFQTGSGAHPASYLMGTGSSLRGGKAAGACEIKNGGAMPILPHTSSLLHGQLYFRLYEVKRDACFSDSL